MVARFVYHIHTFSVGANQNRYDNYQGKRKSGVDGDSDRDNNGNVIRWHCVNMVSRLVRAGTDKIGAGCGMVIMGCRDGFSYGLFGVNKTLSCLEG